MKLLLVVVLVLFVTFGSAYAFPQYGISLSKSCITMIKANMTGCPTYDQIAGVFTDNTDQRITGKLGYFDGIYQRGPSQVHNPFNFYVYRNQSTFWIDPIIDSRFAITTITILPSVPAYKLGDESNKMDDYNITFGKDRWINPNCSEAKITANNWIFLTGDTLNLLRHNCDPSFTHFNSTMTIKLQKSYQDIGTSYKWKLDKWIKENLTNCKIRGCTTVK